MKKYMRSISTMSQDILLTPKKYSTLLGALICYMAVGTISVNSVSLPYFLSYMQVRLNSTWSRYPNSIYLSSALGIADAVSAIIGGLLMNRFKITMKTMYLVGSVISCSGYFLTFLAIKHSFILFAISYSVFFGLSTNSSQL
jgi:hypothetical protein